MIERYEALTETRGVTDGLETDWAAFSGRALSAATLTSLLARHDAQTAQGGRRRDRRPTTSARWTCSTSRTR